MSHIIIKHGLLTVSLITKSVCHSLSNISLSEDWVIGLSCAEQITKNLCECYRFSIFANFGRYFLCASTDKLE